MTIQTNLLLLLISIFLSCQAILSLWQMIYGWLNPKKINLNKMPKHIYPPLTFFSIIVPARHEENVIADTLRQIIKQSYSKNYFEIIIPMSKDDIDTILEVEKIQRNNLNVNIKKVIFYDGPINKPHGLNIALNEAKGDYIVIFDAEDHIHPYLLNGINSLIIEEKRQIIQTGVSLVNWKSNWFSIHPVLEYYYWFNSRLHWYRDKGIIPLAGVGIFIPKEILLKVKGWDEKCLTEDAKLGINCSIKNYPVRLLVDEEYSIQEEVPIKLDAFIKQRTRWIQGFLQILVSKIWKNLDYKKQFYFFTLFLFPIFQLFIYIWSIISLFLFNNQSILITLISFLPLIILLFQIFIQFSGILEISAKRKQLHYAIYLIPMFVLTYFPYQIILFYSTVRAIVRMVTGNIYWEKTTHFNTNRKILNVTQSRI